jgi:hypothetical protein
MTEQKCIAFSTDLNTTAKNIETTINDYIEKGWKVVQLTSTGGVANGNFRYYPTIVVIFERNNNEPMLK